MSRSDVKTLPKTEDNYRSIDRLSYSALKMYDDNRIKFKKKYIDKEEVEDPDNEYIIMGNIVDVLRTDPENYDNYFTIASAPKPTGQMLAFVGFLLKNTLTDTTNGVTSSTMKERLQKSYDQLKEWNGGKLRDKFETVVEKFETEAVQYFKEMLSSIGKTIITTEQAEIGKSIANKLLFSKATKEVVSAEGLTKFPILFELSGTEMKAEIDKMVFDHKEKIIYPFDYKVTNFVEDFVFNAFLKKKYYLQSALYKYAIEFWKQDTEYKDYKVENLSFIVADYNNIYDPLLYKTTDSHYEQGFNGFYVGNTYYKGIFEIMLNLKFSKENDVWGTSMRNFLKEGVIFIPEFKNTNE